MRNTIWIIVIMLLACTVYVSAQLTDSNIGVGSTATSQQATFVNQDPDPAEPGGYVDVRFKLENVGTEQAKAVVFEILPEFPFSLDPGDNATRTLGTVEARQIGVNAYVIHYRLRIDKSAVQGNSQIRVRYSVNNGETWRTLDPFQVRIQSSNPILAIESVTSIPEMIGPGETASISIRLKNMADGYFKNIKATLQLIKQVQTATSVSFEELPFSPIGSTNEKILLRIDIGESANLAFELIADPDTKAGVYKVPIVLGFSDQLGKNYTVTNVFSLKVGEEPDVVVGIDSSTIYQPNTKGKVTIKFINKGSMGVKFVTIQLRKTNDFDVLSSDVSYLGNIDSDDYATGEFDLFLNKGVKDKVLLPITIEFRDANNKKYTQNYNLELKTYTGEQAEKLGLSQGSNTIGIIFVVVIVVAGLVAYRFFKKRKKK
ncbi:MAG: hypothetical protein V1837_07785 [Candidatus Woesearchaeota archaeon]